MRGTRGLGPRSRCAGLGAVLVGAMLLRCSDLTELVVAVDTDLVPGQDFDRVEVRVLSETHNETKRGDVRSAAALPVTLGITAGGNTSANVLVEATAFKGDVGVARTTVTAAMVDGHRKLCHISLCQACPPSAQCGRSFGTSMPDYANALPTKNECAGIFADAGGFDSGNPTTDSGNPIVDSSTPDGGDTGATVCTPACPAGTTCTFGQCKLVGNHACSDPIVVEGSFQFRGTICVGAGQSLDFGTGTACPAARPTGADVFQFGAGKYTATLRSKYGGSVSYINVSDTNCTPIVGCTKANIGGGGATGINNTSGPFRVAVGADNGTTCAEYQLDVTKTQ